ncbi:MAG: CaiB/BaiF CoA transferase family protein [Acidimicrobiales bacterium]
MSGPLTGFRVIELAGIGPGPFACMMLADMGAEVVRVDRLDGRRDDWAVGPETDFLGRGRRSIAVDLKHPDGPSIILALVSAADAIVEGFRPGVMERLGIGPSECTARNPRLVYGRMSGWGQHGPWAARAGHDINYVGLSGVLAAIGHHDRPPVPPLNLLGDFGGGGMLLAFGVVCALLEASVSGTGQVVDASVLDGTILLSTMIQQMRAAHTWLDRREANLLDGGSPSYGVYETADGGYMAVGALEDKFFAEFSDLIGLDASAVQRRHDRAQWPELRRSIASIFSGKSRQQWCDVFEGSDACVTPVLTFDEAGRHPHNSERHAFAAVDSFEQPSPSPRFSRTPGSIRGGAPTAGGDTDDVLTEWGVATSLAAAWRENGAIRSIG